MTSKSYDQRFINWIDSKSKQWLLGIAGAAMMISGPIVASTVRMSPGVALLSLGSVLLYFVNASRGNKS